MSLVGENLHFATEPYRFFHVDRLNEYDGYDKCKAKVIENPFNLQRVPIQFQSYEILEIAINQDGEALEYCKVDQPYELQIKSLNDNPFNIRFCYPQTFELISYALNKGMHNYSLIDIDKLKPDEFEYVKLLCQI